MCTSLRAQVRGKKIVWHPQIQNKNSITDDFPQNLEWNLVKAEAIRNEVIYNCCPDVVYPDITFHVHFQRRSLFYVLNLIFPIALITLLTIVVFILPAESGKGVIDFFVGYT